MKQEVIDPKKWTEWIMFDCRMREELRRERDRLVLDTQRRRTVEVYLHYLGLTC
jgi:hypothetical protein